MGGVLITGLKCRQNITLYVTWSACCYLLIVTVGMQCLVNTRDITYSIFEPIITKSHCLAKGINVNTFRYIHNGARFPLCFVCYICDDHTTIPLTRQRSFLCIMKLQGNEYTLFFQYAQTGLASFYIMHLFRNMIIILLKINARSSNVIH